MMEKLLICLALALYACQEANTTTQATPKKTNEHHVQKGADTKKIEIDSVSYARMDDKINLDYEDTTNQRAIFNSQLLTDFEVFLTGEVNDYSKYKLFYNEMRSARDTVFILNKGQNFYRYIKKDSKTKLVFDAYMENIQSLPKKLKYNILNLSKDRSKPLVINDSTFSISLLVQFKKDTIDRLIFVYYLD